jgi:hypothetical protein
MMDRFRPTHDFAFDGAISIANDFQNPDDEPNPAGRALLIMDGSSIRRCSSSSTSSEMRLSCALNSSGDTRHWL